MDDIKLRKYKTVMCQRLMQSAGCRYGPLCDFAHDENELRRNLQQVWYYGVRCNRGDADGPCSDPSCQYAHNDMEFLYHPNNYKTSMCSQMNRASGCTGNQYCPYAHDQSELRVPSTNGTSAHPPPQSPPPARNSPHLSSSGSGPLNSPVAAAANGHPQAQNSRAPYAGTAGDQHSALGQMPGRSMVGDFPRRSPGRPQRRFNPNGVFPSPSVQGFPSHMPPPVFSPPPHMPGPGMRPPMPSFSLMAFPVSPVPPLRQDSGDSCSAELRPPVPPSPQGTPAAPPAVPQNLPPVTAPDSDPSKSTTQSQQPPVSPMVLSDQLKIRILDTVDQITALHCERLSLELDALRNVQQEQQAQLQQANRPLNPVRDVLRERQLRIAAGAPAELELLTSKALNALEEHTRELLNRIQSAKSKVRAEEKGPVKCAHCCQLQPIAAVFKPCGHSICSGCSMSLVAKQSVIKCGVCQVAVLHCAQLLDDISFLTVPSETEADRECCCSTEDEDLRQSPQSGEDDHSSTAGSDCDPQVRPRPARQAHCAQIST